MKYILLLALFSCRSISDRNREIIFEQCSPQLITDILDGFVYIDLEKSFCECRKYKYSLQFIGPLQESSETKPIMYCDKLVGEHPDVYIKKTTWLQTLRRDLSNVQEETER